MNQEDRDRILQLVAYVQSMNYQSKQAMMDSSNYGRMLDSLQAAQKLCVPIVDSISRTPREYHCPGCDDFQATEESGPNLVCTRCRLVLLVGRRQETPERHGTAFNVRDCANRRNVRAGGVCVPVTAFRGVGGWRYDAPWGNQRGKAAFCGESPTVLNGCNFGRCGGLIRGTRKAPGHHHPGAFLLFGGYVHIRV
jgi:hypothetical protein